MSANLNPPKEVVLKKAELNSYVHPRQISYGRIEEQLDMLFKDIDDGMFGANAKKGAWYKHIKATKDANPKPDNYDTLKQEYEDLMENA
jgi:hypothetical protein